ncbi:hypothetical protein [Marisediminicola antarctica]|uniref:Uncharacterized protein n=1 Tax=Marisediminicola antarctica TaxID=674079 RepID=A0A7L5AG51_9MICO|nr:hypothetical protein [Marisediminicola antarctica]QHO68962.1 hypothetical protein BHD05_04200 [Marisediminicola antarctica]
MSQLSPYAALMGTDNNDTVASFADAMGVAFADNPWPFVFLGVVVVAEMILPNRRSRRRRRR